MATPDGSEWVEIVAGSVTLVIGSKAIWSPDLSPLYAVGRSRGSDFTVAHMQGTQRQGRERDSLPVPIDVVCDGEWDEDGDPVAVPARRATMKAHVRKVLGALDEAPDRAVTIRFHDVGETWEAEGSFEEPSGLDVGPDLAEFSLLFTVQVGTLELAADDDDAS